jgi:hypothetical protein
MTDQNPSSPIPSPGNLKLLSPGAVLPPGVQVENVLRRKRDLIKAGQHADQAEKHAIDAESNQVALDAERAAQ